MGRTSPAEPRPQPHPYACEARDVALPDPAGEKMKTLAVLSVHSCPLAALGGKETGGMNVYVRELGRQLGTFGIQVDVFTRSQNPHISTVVPLGRNARVIHIKAGPEEPVPKGRLFAFLPEFT